MRGIQGVVIAACVGIVGAVCNWYYIHRLSRDKEKVAFVAIERQAQINLGDRFKEAHFVKVDIPKDNLGRLDETAVKWDALDTLIDLPATRSFQGGEILLHQDLKTPASKELNDLIGENERVMWLPVDARSFNPQHVNPGDEVSFRIPSMIGITAGSRPGQTPKTGSEEIIGPFRILALGNRKGSSEVHRASGLSAGSENTIAISVKIENDQLEPKAQRISEVMQMTNFNGVQILLHPAIE